MPADIATIERTELKDWTQRKRPFVLVEVLTEPQYQAGHLPGAINIPLGRLRELAPKLLPDQQAEIVVYCGSFT